MIKKIRRLVKEHKGSVLVANPIFVKDDLKKKTRKIIRLERKKNSKIENLVSYIPNLVHLERRVCSLSRGK